MEKTKLSIPASVLIALCGLVCLYGGYVLAGILVGFVLLKEEDLGLKRACAKFFALLLVFALASTVLNLIPSLLQLLYSFLAIFNVHFYIDFIHSFFNLLSSVLSLLKTLVFLFLSAMALLGKEIKVPVLDPLMEKYIN